ncbi:MAG: outer membrane protein assembly factor BamA [Gammaproteobacteria bacterium]|nr:outer membrane protein assembly factor BamA [Gammaproteobacteria bacterium]NNM12658.1 outer membrane protein assembly factor BamA [Pseudomonadales bacterium]
MPRSCMLVLLVLIQPGLLIAATKIDDIRIEGLQRVSADSVFAILPLRVGDTPSEALVAQTVREIFRSGNFQDVEVGLDDSVLVIKVAERPSISEISIEGNKAIRSEDLLEGLEKQGMAEGRVFQRATLEGMRRELARQYSSQGRYDATVTTDVVAEPRNRVAIDIVVDEGKPARIKQINIVGNRAFSDQELLERMELRARGFFTAFNGKNKYAREKLSGDIENIEAYYRDRGYIRFRVAAANVSLGPRKDSVYISITVEEGERYEVAAVNLAGEVKQEAAMLERAFLLGQGQIFSQARVTATEELMKRLLGNLGFAFAEVKGVPEIDEDNKTVDVTFVVEPGKRTYVRRVEFSGNRKTSDHVLRREMRQLEAGIASTELIERSRVRLERLGYFEKVEVETPKVPGSEDLVDAKFSVTEQSFGSVSASLGFSQDVGLIFGADFQQNNFMGSGRQVSVQANRSRFRTNYSVSYVNPYYTAEGVSRGFTLFARETDFDEINVTSFSTNSWGGSVIFGYPLSETQSLRFSLGYTDTEIETGQGAVQEIAASPLPFLDASLFPGIVLEPGIAYKVDENIDFNQIYTPGTSPELVLTSAADFAVLEPGFVDKNGDNFGVFTLTGSWRQSTLNRGIFPTAGVSNSLALEATIPGSDIDYYKLSYNGQYYWPLSRNLTLRIRGELGYGRGYGGVDELPFFENYFSGGIGSVRGFESNTLGPKSSPARIYDRSSVRVGPTDSITTYITQNGELLSSGLDTTPDPFGGNILTEGSVELILPTPFAQGSRAVRTVAFYDIGNVFNDACRSTQINCDNFDAGKLRSTVGLALTWLSGFGPLSFSFGVPLEKEDGDETEFFQFTLGGAF